MVSPFVKQFIDAGMGFAAGLSVGLALWWRPDAGRTLAQPVTPGSRSGTPHETTNVQYGLAPSQSLPLHTPPTREEISLAQQQLNQLGYWQLPAEPSGVIDSATRAAYAALVRDHHGDWQIYTARLAPGFDHLGAEIGFVDYVYSGTSGRSA